MEKEPFTLEAGWAQLCYLAQFLFRLFATPAELAAQMILRREKRREILQWLAPLEAAARRLILLAALELPAPNAPALASPCGFGAAFRDRPAPLLPENAEDWRVQFHVFRVSETAPAPGRPRPRGAPGIRYDAIALARRIEALRRVLDDRVAAVRLLARRLADRVLGAPRQIRARVARWFAPYRYKRGGVAWLLSAVQREVDVALIRFESG